MKQLMKAKHMVEATKVCGEKITCDVCGKVIVDTTQVEYDDTRSVGYNSLNVWFHRVHTENPDRTTTDYDACSADCIRNIFEKYINTVNENGHESHRLSIRDISVNIGELLRKYFNKFDDIPMVSSIDWEKYKKDAIPVEDD